jgi:hypothetical protein
MAKTVKKKSTKKVVRTEKDQYLIDLLNRSQEVQQTVMECGSAYASDLLDLETAIWKTAREYGFKQDNLYSKYF